MTKEEREDELRRKREEEDALYMEGIYAQVGELRREKYARELQLAKAGVFVLSDETKEYYEKWLADNGR